MNHVLNKTLSALGLAAVGVCFAGSATAGCFDVPPSLQEPTMQKEAWGGDPRVRMMKVDSRHHEDEDIVGLWNIVVTAKDGTIVDHGLQHWHDDGTEFLNSENHNPASQNFCMGIWERTGPNEYQTNHFAFSYAAGAGEPTFVVRIRSKVSLSRGGDAMFGEETTEVFTPDGVNLLATLKGALVGKRVTLGTTVKDIH